MSGFLLHDLVMGRIPHAGPRQHILSNIICLVIFLYLFFFLFCKQYISKLDIFRVNTYQFLINWSPKIPKRKDWKRNKIKIIKRESFEEASFRQMWNYYSQGKERLDARILFSIHILKHAHTHTHACTHTHMCAYTSHYNSFN